MQQLIPTLLIAAVFAWVIGFALASAAVQARRDRRRIMAEGMSTEATITQTIAKPQSNSCRVTFTFQPLSVSTQVQCTQNSTPAALTLTRLGEGSTTRVYYLPKRPRRAFIDALAVAERVAAVTQATPGAAAGSNPYFVSYAAPAQSMRISTAFQGTGSIAFRRTSSNAFRWTGPGDVTFTDQRVYFTALRARPFWFPRTVRRDVAREAVVNVEAFENIVRCEIQEPAAKPRAIQFWTVNAADAKAIAARLPAIKTATFAPQMAEQAEFSTRLHEITPNAPVTPTLLAINVAVFLLAALLGGGILIPNVDVLIRLGSNYTPLTAAGQWWRLLTSTFLHFGVVHLAFNMWALWVFGSLAERVFGNSRYLLIYLTAGVAGSLASFLWHPFVNGAGASGAIFGVLGSLLAFFLRADQGVPKSVLKTQRNSAAIFIAYSLLNGARVRGIDNAAHLGGLVAGLVMGFLLRRPLDRTRSEQTWGAQWVRACATIVVVATFIGLSLASGRLHPRLLQDEGGHPIPTAALGPLLRSFAGVTIGMRPGELVKAKGTPVMRTDPNHWIYNSIDAAHDGLLDVYFNSTAGEQSRYVRAVLFSGKDNAAPGGMPDLLGLTRDQLVRQFGEPTYVIGPSSDRQYLGFRNGIFVFIASGRTKAYGVYEPP